MKFTLWMLPYWHFYPLYFLSNHRAVKIQILCQNGFGSTIIEGGIQKLCGPNSFQFWPPTSPKGDKNWHFTYYLSSVTSAPVDFLMTSHRPLLVHVVIECPQAPTKGQLISKSLFGVFNFPKKWTKTIRLTTIVVKSNCFVRFLGEDTIKTFWH